MKISGLATGMDTESIIKDLMQANRIPLDKITQKKQYLQWQLDDYRSINRNLKTTSNKVFDTIMKQSTFTAKSVSVSNPDAVDVKGKGASTEFSGTISVQRLATQATTVSVKKSVDTSAKLSTVLPSGIAPKLVVDAVDKEGKMISTEIEIDINSDTIDSVLQKINSQSGVSAFYDTFKEQFVVTAKNTGNNGTTNPDISITGNVAEFMGIADNSVGILSSKGLTSQFTLNGFATERSSNTFQVNDMEITLKKPTTETVTFSSAPDTEKIVDEVVKFVDDYNKMIEELNAKIRESKYRDFQPLSTEEKAGMKEKEIEMWEEKAKSGTLRNDPEITSMLTKLRTIMSSSVKGTDGKSISLKDLGITTSTSYTENGKLIIDETKLRAAIADDPNKAYELFAKPSVESNDPTLADKGGIARQFRAVIDSSQAVIAKRAGKVGDVNDTFTLGRNMKDMNKQIERFEDRLKQVESRLWKQFNAMESAIQRLNSQSASIMSSFGGA
ncbi:flagellar hook-associated protein 2 [Sporosarcina sp. FSL K6-1508]|uniref:flagellar hook-associated protein 2 n=1 Tax=Sporosarcina sp. FSL K6-1508 TaxID=2921553 RepID=UPI0030FB183C